MADPYSFLLDDTPTPQEEAAARIAALRGQRSLGMIAQLSGSHSLQPFANSVIGDADRQEQALRQEPTQRLTQALQAQKLREGNIQLEQNQIDEQEKNDPSSIRSQFSRALVGKMMPGQTLPPGATAAQIERSLPLVEKMWQAEQMRMARLEARRDAQNKAKEPKPIPEQEATKIVNQSQAPASIDELEELQKDVGLSGLLAPVGIHVGAEGRYHDAVNNLASSIAAGAAPAARENAQLMEEFKRGFPTGLNSAGRAHEAFSHLKHAVQNNLAAQLAAARAAGYSPEQIAEIERRAVSSSPPTAAPKAPRRTDPVTKETRVWNGSAWVKE